MSWIIPAIRLDEVNRRKQPLCRKVALTQSHVKGQS